MDNTDSKFVRPGDPRVPCFAILGWKTSELKLVNLEGGSSSSVKISDDWSLGIVAINGEVFAVTREDILKLRSDGTTEHNMSLPVVLDINSRIVLFQKKIYIIRPGRESMLCFDPADNSLTDDLPGCGMGYGFCASATDEFICAMGGAGTETRSTKFDPLTRAWEEIAPMWKERKYAAAATLDGKIYVIGGLDHPTSVEYYNPGNNSWTEISDMNAGREYFFSACVDGDRLYAVGGDGEKSQRSIEVYDKNKWTVVTKFQTKYIWTYSCFWPHGSHQPGDPIPEIQHFIEKLESSVAKEERLKLFHEILEYEPWQQRDIAKTIGSIDFSGVALQSPDVSAIRSIINHSAHLDSVNLKACKLLPGSLQILSNRVIETVKVDKLRVDGNPDLTVDDLIAGVDLCARVGARYVYDLDHLSASDWQKFTSHSRKYQPKDESAEKKMSKTRKSLIREQRFQKMYKKPSRNERERIRHVLDFNSKFEEQPEPAERSKEDPEAKTPPASSLGEGKVGSLQRDVEPAEGSKEDQEEEQRSGNSRRAEDVGSIQFDTEPPGGGSSSGTVRKIRPRTLNEFVKLKPVEKFNKMMKSASSGEEVLEAEGRAMHARMLKTMAMNSDRRRFESASLNKFGSKLRPYMRNTRLEVSTGIVKSSKDDSGYKTRSSFSETLSCKSNLRKYSRRSDQDTERKSSIESTQAASLERIEEVETSAGSSEASKSGSSDSKILPKTGKHHQKHEHDLKRLMEQRFEMTVLGLGALQNRQEQLQLWMENAQFDVLPTDLGATAGQTPDCKLQLLEFQYSPLSADKKIGPEGDNLSLDESSLAIPPNSLIDTQNLCISMLMGFQYLDLPANRIPVSPYFDVKFLGELRIPAKARVPTWFRPLDGSEHGIKIYKRYRNEENKFVWRELPNEVTLRDDIIEFEVDHFCGFIAMIPDWLWGNGQIKLSHGLFNFERSFLSVFCYHSPKSLFQQIVANLEKNNYKEIYRDIYLTNTNQKVPIRMECFDVDLHEFVPPQRLLSPSDMKCKETVRLPFLLKHHEEPKDEVDIKYIVDDFSAPFAVKLDSTNRAPQRQQPGLTRVTTEIEGAATIQNLHLLGTGNTHDHRQYPKIGAGSRSIAAGRDVFNVHGGALILCVLVLFILCSVMFAFLLVYFWFGLSPRFLQSFSTDHDEI